MDRQPVLEGMLAHSLEQVERVVFNVGETNGRSRRAMEKIGGRLTDRLVSVEGPNGPLVHVVYEITCESFASGPLSLSGSASAGDSGPARRSPG